MVEYRLLGEGDLDLLVELRARDLMMYQDQPVLDNTRASIREFYAMKMGSDECYTMVGSWEGRIIATATIYYYGIMPNNDNPSGMVGRITNVWVAEDFRRQGIARHMVSDLIRRHRGNVGIIELNASEPGMPLYRSLGFELKKNHMVLKCGTR